MTSSVPLQNNHLSSVKNGRHFRTYHLCVTYVSDGILCQLDEIEDIAILVFQDVYQYVQE